jgi:hypothetical protein
MTITAVVVGVRLWPKNKGSRRVVTLQWDEPVLPGEEFHYSHNWDLPDDLKILDLGSRVQIDISVLP